MKYPPNPYPVGPLRKLWRHGFYGNRCLVKRDSDYGRAYAEGKAARQAIVRPAAFRNHPGRYGHD